MNGEGSDSTKDTKRCPFCAEEIKAAAIKCKHCGSWLNGTSSATHGSNSTSQGTTAPRAKERHWYRRYEGRILAGVCSGLAERFDVSVTAIRLLFVFLTLLGGHGILIYIILWVIMPVDPTEPVPTARGTLARLADAVANLANRFIAWLEQAF